MNARRTAAALLLVACLLPVCDSRLLRRRVAPAPADDGDGDDGNSSALGTSFLATVIPIVGKKHPRLRIGDYSFALGKNFGTGVILATGFIHMLIPATDGHQFFEGIALSTTVLDSGFTTLLQPMLVVLFYSCTTPAGIALGIALSRTYNQNSTSALLVQGCFDGVSGGVLIYDGLVNLLTANVTNSREFASRSAWGRLGIYVAVWIGAAAMAIVGRWA
eukprot:m51a1_g9102 putative zinc zip family (219) ;mRNA; r:78622-80046